MLHSISSVRTTRRVAHRIAQTFAANVAALAFCITPAFAYVTPASPPSGNEADLSNHDTYRNRDGETVHAPARSRSGRVPEGATARCRDASYSFSRHRSGTCSRHGGVADWL